jgi:DUF917 family protein
MKRTFTAILSGLAISVASGFGLNVNLPAMAQMTMHFSAPLITNSGLGDVLGEKHFITIAVTGFPLESLMITLPQDMRTLEGATVTDQNGQKIAANVAITQGSIALTFAQPVKPNNYLTVELTGVRMERQGGTAIYRVNSVNQGLPGTIPIGTAVIRLSSQS